MESGPRETHRIMKWMVGDALAELKVGVAVYYAKQTNNNHQLSSLDSPSMHGKGTR